MNQSKELQSTAMGLGSSKKVILSFEYSGAGDMTVNLETDDWFLPLKGPQPTRSFLSGKHFNILRLQLEVRTRTNSILCTVVRDG